MRKHGEYRFIAKVASMAMMCVIGVSLRVGGSFGNRAFSIGSLSSIKKNGFSSELKAEVKHSGYDVIERDLVEEYGAHCTLYRHKKSGGEVLSVTTDDDNKVFGITLRTPPDDSTGVPHILEHSVLCGSRKYKTKDPFVHLLKGSLQTFLNAFTYPDRTCYVVASQNEKDFYNLINVYTDAVFHPRAVKDPMVHAQEGWHLELENEKDALTYKGVVYNEMKGVYSSPDSLLTRASQRSLFPDNTYNVDSGGDPRVIPDLTFEDFKKFHERFYHPSNARIYFSGDDDVYNRLEIIDSYLKEFDVDSECSNESKVKMQPLYFKEAQRIKEYYPCDANQPETHLVQLNWLLNDKRLSAYEELCLGVLDHLLVGKTSSKLRKTLMESGLGDAITGGGVSDELLQNTFSLGLKGVEPQNVERVEQLIMKTLKDISQEGFSKEEIASSLNTVEFQLREFNTGSFPKGLSFMLGAMSNWLYDESPTNALKFEEPLALLKQNLKDNVPVFQDILKKNFVDNTHRTVVELAPSKTLEEELIKDEQERLANIKATLSKKEIKEIIQKTEELKELQASQDPPEARATIPSLTVSDLNPKTTEYPIDVSHNEENTGITVIRHKMGSTSGIAYVNLAVDLNVLNFDDVKLLPLLTSLMTETGAGEYDFVGLSQRIGTYTGGITTSLLKTPQYSDDETKDQSILQSGDRTYTAKLMIRGKATTENMDELFSLYQLILKEARFDSQNKVIELLKEGRSQLESTIQGAGHAIANSRLKARYTFNGYVDEMIGGVSSLDTIKELLREAQEDWPSLLTKLERIRTQFLTSPNPMVLDITGDEKVLNQIQPNVVQFLKTISTSSNSSDVQHNSWAKQADILPIKDEGFVVPTQVSYVGKAGLLFKDGEKISGSAAVVSNFLKTGYLWDRVRVMGGAYGGFCTFSAFSGFFSFLSYRDPNLHETLQVYDLAHEALMEAYENMLEDPDILHTAIIGTIAEMDGPKSPDQKGFTSFQHWLTKQTSEYRQQFRDEILNTKPSDFRDFALRLKNIHEPSVAVVSSKPKFQEAADAGTHMSLNDIF